MSRIKAVHYILCFALLFITVLAGLAGNQTKLIAQEQPPVQEKLELSCKYPVLSAKSGEIFEFSVELKYQGEERRRFDLTLTTPPDWGAFVVAGYPEKQIPAIEMGPSGLYPTPETVKVQFGPLRGKFPQPGDYVLTLEASAGALKESIKLKAVVTARYEVTMSTATGRLNTEVDAGKENHLSIELINTGSAVIENITFSSTKPEGWTITFAPDKVKSLDSGLTQEVDVVIKPPSKTIAGDYMITLKAESKEYSPDSLQIRVTVLTPTIWGWVGVLIVLVVIAGVGVVFWRLGRR